MLDLRHLRALGEPFASMTDAELEAERRRLYALATVALEVAERQYPRQGGAGAELAPLDQVADLREAN
jgi:hypothetical protein